MSAIVFMPWAKIKKPVTLGNVCVEPWSQAQSNAPPVEVTCVNKMFSRFFDCDRSLIKDIAVCKLDKNPIFPSVNQDQIEEIRDAVNALVFATIAPGIISAVAKNKKNPGSSNADRFNILVWDLPTSRTIKFKIGQVEHHCEINKLEVLQPFHVMVAGEPPNEDVVKDMQKLFTLAAKGREDAKRIIRSLEWFKWSQTNSPDVTFRSKLVMLITAFEILLKFPIAGKKAAYFALEIEKYRSMADLTDQETIDRNQLILSKKAIWAFQFYKLRNKIVHGDYVHPKDIWFTSTKCTFLNFDLVGSILFNECISRKMADLHCCKSLTKQPWKKAYKLIEWVS